MCFRTKMDVLRTVLLLFMVASCSQCKPALWCNENADESEESSEDQSSEEDTLPETPEPILPTLAESSGPDLNSSTPTFSGAEAATPTPSATGLPVNMSSTLVPSPPEGPDPSQAETAVEPLTTSPPANASTPQESRGDM